ncbi:MAG: RNA polymerase sigma-70 factor [Rhodothermales bacterium]
MLDAATLQTLCKRLTASDRSAFEDLFRLTRTPLLRYVCSIVRDNELAHDLVQDVFVMLWGLREGLDPSQPLKPYLYRMARNRALRHLRDSRTHARKEAELGATMPTMTETSADDDHDTDLMKRQLHQWIKALPDRQREALTLSRFHYLSHREIGALMGISPRTVNNHIIRALDALQQRAEHFAAAYS